MFLSAPWRHHWWYLLVIYRLSSKCWSLEGESRCVPHRLAAATSSALAGRGHGRVRVVSRILIPVHRRGSSLVRQGTRQLGAYCASQPTGRTSRSRWPADHSQCDYLIQISGVLMYCLRGRIRSARLIELSVVEEPDSALAWSKIRDTAVLPGARVNTLQRW